MGLINQKYKITLKSVIHGYKIRKASSTCSKTISRSNGALTWFKYARGQRRAAASIFFTNSWFVKPANDINVP